DTPDLRPAPGTAGVRGVHEVPAIVLRRMLDGMGWRQLVLHLLEPRGENGKRAISFLGAGIRMRRSGWKRPAARTGDGLEHRGHGELDVMNDRKSVPQCLDAGLDLMQTMGPGYVAFLALASLPWRFGVALVAARAIEMGADALNFDPYWVRSCAVLSVLFVLHTAAQLVFSRAALLTLDEGIPPPPGALKGGLTALPSVLFLVALAEAAFFLSFVTILPPLLAWTASGTLLGTRPVSASPSVVGAWRALRSERAIAARAVGVHAFSLLIAFIVFVNLGALSQGLPALLGLIPGFPVERVLATVSLDQARVMLGLWAFASAIVEPVRLCAVTVLGFERASVRTGRDLRARLRRMSAEPVSA
ncbi:MAG: hypothetical protein ABI672_19940, partial [Vicinamibacteria bacterium]